MGRRGRIGRKAVDELLDDAAINIVLGKERAISKYAYMYKKSEPRKLGWTLYLLDYLNQHAAEINSKEGKAKANYVMDLVKEAAEKWRKMPAEEKKKWIESAKGEVNQLKARLHEELKLGDEIERLVKEAIKGIEVIAEAI